jgi:hypothetical protein
MKPIDVLGDRISLVTVILAMVCVALLVLKASPAKQSSGEFIGPNSDLPVLNALLAAASAGHLSQDDSGRRCESTELP